MARARCETVSAEREGMRLDSFLASIGAYASRSAAARAIEEGLVLVGGDPKHKGFALSAGDAVVFEDLPEVERAPIEGQDIPLDVRFEDEHLIVLSKQTGLCVHPSPGHYDSTLCHALVHQYGRDRLAHIQGDDRPGIVHRLDMETSGLMLCAKTDVAGERLQDMIRLRNVDRRYIALVHGNVAHDTGMIDQPITRGYSDRLRMVVGQSGNSREAITTFSVLERFDSVGRDMGYTLLECKLFTGRTHQIRVHMEFIGHCCVGDPLYSWGPENIQLGLHARQFLHSWSLSFTHPITGEELTFTDGLPPDLSGAYASITPRSLGKTPEGRRIMQEVAQSASQSVAMQLDMIG